MYYDVGPTNRGLINIIIICVKKMAEVIRLKINID